MGIAVRGRFVRTVADDEFDVLQTGAEGTAILRGGDPDDVDESGAAVAGSYLNRASPPAPSARSASTRVEYSSIDHAR